VVIRQILPPLDHASGDPRYNPWAMRAAESLPDVSRVIEVRGEPAYRLERVCSPVRGREEATNLPGGLRAAPAAKHLRGRPAVLSR